MSLPTALNPTKLHYHHYTPNGCNNKLPPIVFVHGITSNFTTWNKVMLKIADKTHREIYAVDLRDHGKSEWTGVFNLDVTIGDLDHFLDQKGIKESILVGHSMGGLIAGCLAMLKPSLVNKLIVEDQKFDVTRDYAQIFIEAAKALKLVQNLPKHYTEKEAQLLMERVIKTHVMQYESHYLSLRKDAHGKFHLGFNLEAIVRAAEDESLYSIDQEKCKQYSGPVLFIYGAKSMMRVNEDKMIPKYFPNVQLFEMKTASHILHLTFPDEFVEKVSDFINT